MAKQEHPPIEWLRKAISYDAETGVLTWAPRGSSDGPGYRCFNGKLAGKQVGSPESSTAAKCYRKSGIRMPGGGVFYGRAHVLAWLIAVGPVPAGMVIDHRDGDRANNRLSNLRVCTQRENTWNTGLRASNRSGVSGVSFRDETGKWRARIAVAGNEVLIGNYLTKEEAISARLAAEAEYYGEYAPSARICVSQDRVYPSTTEPQ